MPRCARFSLRWLLFVRVPVHCCAPDGGLDDSRVPYTEEFFESWKQFRRCWLCLTRRVIIVKLSFHADFISYSGYSFRNRSEKLVELFSYVRRALRPWTIKNRLKKCFLNWWKYRAQNAQWHSQRMIGWMIMLVITNLKSLIDIGGRKKSNKGWRSVPPSAVHSQYHIFYFLRSFFNAREWNTPQPCKNRSKEFFVEKKRERKEETE